MILRESVVSYRRLCTRSFPSLVRVPSRIPPPSPSSSRVHGASRGVGDGSAGRSMRRIRLLARIVLVNAPASVASKVASATAARVMPNISTPEYRPPPLPFWSAPRSSSMRPASTALAFAPDEEVVPLKVPFAAALDMIPAHALKVPFTPSSSPHPPSQARSRTRRR